MRIYDQTDRSAFEDFFPDHYPGYQAGFFGEEHESIGLSLNRPLSCCEKIQNCWRYFTSPVCDCLGDFQCSRSFVSIVGGTCCLAGGVLATSLVSIVNRISDIGDMSLAVSCVFGGVGLTWSAGSDLWSLAQTISQRRHTRLQQQPELVPPIHPTAYRKGLIHLFFGLGAIAATSCLYNKYTSI